MELGGMSFIQTVVFLITLGVPVYVLYLVIKALRKYTR